MNQSVNGSLIEGTYSPMSAAVGTAKWTQSNSVSSSQLPLLVFFIPTSSIIKVALCAFGFICNVVGNSLTLIVIRITPKLRTKTDIILCSLTMADLLVAMDIIYFSVFMFVDRAFANPCKYAVPMTVFTAFAKAPAYVSSFHLVVAAVDRYVAIVHPFAYEDRLTDGVVRAMLAAAWIVGCLLGASHWMWFIDSTRLSICNIVSPAYSWLEVVIFVGVSTTVATTYCIILNVAWKHHVRIQSEMASVWNARYANDTSGVTVTTSTTDSQQGHEHKQNAKLQQVPVNGENESSSHDVEHIQTKVRRREFRAVYLTAAIVGSYVVLWSPY